MCVRLYYNRPQNQLFPMFFFCLFCPTCCHREDILMSISIHECLYADVHVLSGHHCRSTVRLFVRLCLLPSVCLLKEIDIQILCFVNSFSSPPLDRDRHIDIFTE